MNIACSILLPNQRATVVLAALAILLAGCAPAGVQPGGPVSAGPSQSGAPTARTRVVVAGGVDPTGLATKLSAGGLFGSDYVFLSNSPLVVLDAQGAAHPLLAAELPSQDRGTWTVHPDGTMATTWKIRPNALWHDGEPVTSKDFALALQVYLDDAIEVRDRQPERLIDSIDPVDATTFVIRWKQVYPWANQMKLGQLEPLPEHAVGELYASGDKVAFQNAPFWTTAAYVGTGPYRLVEWEHGLQLTYRGFNSYFMGQPKIDELVVRVVTDVNTVVANVLSGAVDATLGALLTQAGRVALKQQWETTGQGQIATTPTYHYVMQIQVEPARARPTALTDVRVRQALLHGLDRDMIADVLSEGASPMTDVMVPPNDPLYPRVQQVIAKHPFDLTRAFALMRESGWTRAPSGELMDARGEPFRLNIVGPQQADNATLMDLVDAGLSVLGMQVSQTAVPQAQARGNPEYSANFPGLRVYGIAIDLPTRLNTFTSPDCPTPENRFTGTNGGCYHNSEVDRLFRAATTSLQEGERAEATVQIFKIVTEEAPLLGFAYFMENVAVRTGLVGPGPRWPAQGGTTWNVHEWYWES